MIGGVTPGDDATMTISALRDDKIVLEITQADSRVEIAGVDDWYNSQTLGLDNSTIFGAHLHQNQELLHMLLSVMLKMMSCTSLLLTMMDL